MIPNINEETTHEKGPLRTTQALISLRIRTGWSGPSLSAYRINGYCCIYRRTENTRLSGPTLSARCIRVFFVRFASSGFCTFFLSLAAFVVWGVWGGLDILVNFSHYYKKDNFCCFLFAFLHIVAYCATSKKYGRTSIARIPLVRLPWLIQLVFWDHTKFFR